MRKFHELPKDILVQFLVNVNNLSSLTYEELEERERNIVIEKKRRSNVRKCEVIKKSLFQLKSFPHLREFIIENTDMIKSIQLVTNVDNVSKITIKGIEYFLIDISLPFLKTLSNLYIKPGWEFSLLQSIESYVRTGDDDYRTRWLNTTQIDYNLCAVCNKKEVLFQYENTKHIRIRIDELDLLNCITDMECIVKCHKCEKIHCTDHIC